MRYVIETKDAGALNTIRGLANNGKMKIVEQGDPVEAMRAKLEQIKLALEVLKKSGVSEDLLISHIKIKTDMSFKDIEAVLRAQKDFFEKLGIKTTEK